MHTRFSLDEAVSSLDEKVRKRHAEYIGKILQLEFKLSEEVDMDKALEFHTEIVAEEKKFWGEIYELEREHQEYTDLWKDAPYGSVWWEMLFLN